MDKNDDHIGQGDEDSTRTLHSIKPMYELGSTIGCYKLLSVLGEGGFGMVYLAEQQHPIKRLVALKVIKPGMDTKQVIARFETERQALAMLDHPHIARVFDAGATEAGRPYFAMEYVKGIPITEYCDKYKLCTQERLRLFIPLCQAIQHAHNKGIIHRDIKPSNALVMLHDEKPIPKIIDFGVAKALNQRLTERTLFTEQGQFIGTPEYMSPEQAELTGLDVDTRTDIYSLGVLLYELLTGCTPFDSEDLRSKGYGEMQRIICEQDPVKPSRKLTTLGGRLEDITKRRSATADQLLKSVRGDLDWIVMKCLDKDRTRRYETANGLAMDIERHLNSESVMARPPSKLYRFQKLVRRNKAAFAAVTVVAAALALAAAGWWLVSQRGARDQITSLAVKPLDDFSGDPNQAYLSDGMTEALCSALGNISGLRVPGRASVMRYKGGQKSIREMGQELNVDAIVEGSVQRAGNRMLITVQLVEVATDRHLWSTSFERDLGEFFKVQSEVALAIAAGVQVRLTPEDQARLARARRIDPRVAEACLLGAHHWSKFTEAGLTNAFRYFRQAIAIDPTYAPAHSGLSACYGVATGWLYAPAESVPPAKAEAQKAIDLDPTFAEGYGARGMLRFFDDWDWRGAESDLRRAIELNPNGSGNLDCYAGLLCALGRIEEALAEQRKSLALDPVSVAANHGLGIVHYYARRFDDAIAQARGTLELDASSLGAHLTLALSYSCLDGHADEARAYAQKALQIDPRNPSSLAVLGYVYGVTGQRAEAMKLLQELEQMSKYRFVWKTLTAVIHIGLGDNSEALTWLDRAFEDRDAGLVWLKVDPIYDSLRSEPAFQTLLKRLNFPP